MVAFVLVTSGCQASEPLVPKEIYQQVNDDGREWTYDTAWQNIRKLNADLDASELSELSEQALFIASQMERLEKGKAGPLRDSSVVSIIERVAEETKSRSTELNLREAQGRALRLQESFDGGDFLGAKEAAVEIHVITSRLNLVE